jgi:SPP1 family predicted phage head-tail adaptor
MRSGSLRHRIVIERRGSGQTASGQQVHTWTTFWPCAAEVTPIAGREFFAAKQINSEITHSIRIRYKSGIDARMRVNFKGRIFELMSPPIDKLEKNHELILMCKELPRDS